MFSALLSQVQIAIIELICTCFIYCWECEFNHVALHLSHDVLMDFLRGSLQAPEIQLVLMICLHHPPLAGKARISFVHKLNCN